MRDKPATPEPMPMDAIDHQRKVPARVAPLSPIALAVIAGIVMDRYGIRMVTLQWALLALGCAALGIVAARTKWLGHFLLFGAFIALAGAWHHWRWSDLNGDDLARTVDDEARPAWVRGVVVEALGHRDGTDVDGQGITRAVVEITEAQTPDGWKSATGRALMSVSGDREDFQSGDAIEAAGGLATIAEPLNPGEFDYHAYLRTQGVRLRLAAEGVWKMSIVEPDHGLPRWWDSLRRRWLRAIGTARELSRRALERNMDEEQRPLAEALVLGRRENVDPELNSAFSHTGTTHLLAISGLHMQVVALVFGLALKTMGIGRKPAFASVAAATLAYVVLVGWMPSVVRSAVMTWIYCLAGLCDRGHRPANTLAAAARSRPSR